MPSSDSKRHVLDSPKLWLPLYAAAAIFAAGFCWVVGHRGVLLIDQSILFDGAWRIIQGQTQYRDFFSTFPPMAFLIQAVFFRLFGVNFSATVISATVLNFGATICVMCLIARLLPRQKICVLIGGLLTAVWFQAPFGTLWFEQTAFAFNLLALTLIVYASGKDDASATALRIAAGVLLGAAALSKQNAGLEFIPVALSVAVLPDIRRPGRALRMAGHILAGLFVASGGLAVWLWKNSSFAAFWHDYFAMAAQIESDRSGSVLLLGQHLLVRMVSPRYILALVALGLVQFSRKMPSEIPNHLLIKWIAFGSIFYQALFTLHSFNDLENSLPYLGIIYGLSFGLLLEKSAQWIGLEIKPLGRPAALGVLAFLAIAGCGLIFVDGLSNSWYRTVQEFGPQTSFADSLNSTGMSGVRWGDPTPMTRPEWRRVVLDRRNFEDLNEWLTKSNANFFVFKDATMLYGLHHRVSPQPWLYFSPGHGFRNDELPRIDAAVVESLRHNKVEIIIVEKDTWADVGLLERMPKLAAFIAEDFGKVREFGVYKAYLRNDWSIASR